MQMKIRKSFIILFSSVIAILLVLACAFMLAPKTTAHADTEETHDHSTMKDLSGFAGIGILGGEWYLGEDTNGDITIGEGGEVTICLNGHTLTGSGTGSVITVKEGAKLTLCDCVGDGSITGGTGTDVDGNTYGGGVYVKENGSFIMAGGTIIGNTAEYGGGVRVAKNGNFLMLGGDIAVNTADISSAGVDVSGGSFEMHGGVISGNTTDGTVGGVCVSFDGSDGTGGSFKMTGGLIFRNTALIGGGVVVDKYSTFIMEDGSITGNIGEYGTGGVILGAGTFKMSGGEISGNVQNQDMTGLGYCGGVSLGYPIFEPDDEMSFEISGAPIITGNKAVIDDSEVENNVVVSDYCKITVTGELTTMAKIGINDTGAVATGFTQGDKASNYFIPDNPENCAYVSDEETGTVTIGTHDIITHEAQQPTCTEKGWEAYEGCSRCDYATDKVEIPALGHKYGEWTVVKQATEAEEGEERRVCENDNTHYETRTTPKLTPSTPETPSAPAEQKKSYVWICWLLIPFAIAVGGITLGILVYKKKL